MAKLFLEGTDFKTIVTELEPRKFHDHAKIALKIKIAASEVGNAPPFSRIFVTLLLADR